MPPMLSLTNSNVKVLATSALALAIILPFFIRKRSKPKSKYIDNASAVAKQVNEGESIQADQYPEYDVVIVGGG